MREADPMGSTRYVQITCFVCGAMVRIMGEQPVPERCPDCKVPLGMELRKAGRETTEKSEPAGPSGPRSALVRLFAIRT
jgi:hypothetical protein